MAHIKTFQHPPGRASANRGLSSDPNEKLAHDLGVRHVVIPKRGYRSKARVQHEHKAWFVKSRLLIGGRSLETWRFSDDHNNWGYSFVEIRKFKILFGAKCCFKPAAQRHF